MQPQPQLPPTRRGFLTAGAGLAAASAALSCQAAQTEAAQEMPEAESDDIKQLDELFADLTEARSSVEPIRAAEHQARMARLGQLLAASPYDALLMEAGATMSYLADFSWGRSERLFGLIVLADGSHFWIAPAFEEQKALLKLGKRSGFEDADADVLTWQEHEYPFKPLAAALRERRVQQLAIEPSLRHRFASGMAQELGAANVGIGTDLVVELRGRKDAHELALLRRANELTQKAILAASERLEAGMTGADIGRLMTHAQRRLGLTGIWNLSLIGPAAAFPHGEERAVPLARGDVILVDTGGGLHGYQSDNTRTWVFDAPVSPRVETVWRAVQDAQRCAFEAIRPGVPSSAIDGVARERIDAHGFGPGYATFTHRLGHGIGLEGHEDPYFDGGSEVVLAEGMTLSDEPGIYLYGEFGVRLEDIVVVTADGADHFGTWQRDPRSPA